MASQLQAEEVNALELEQATEQCDYDCSAVSFIDNLAYIIVKDTKGKAFKVIPVDIPSQVAIKKSVPVNISALASASNHSADDLTRVENYSYTTDKEMVQITLAFFYDFGGSLFDVQLKEFRHPQPNS